MRILLLCLLFLLGGCGYHVQGRQSNLPPDVRLVSVDLFENRTLEPLLENEITNAVVERFARGRVLSLVGADSRKDAFLSGTITSYRTEPVSYDLQDDIVEYRSTLSVVAVMRRAENGSVVWSGSATWNEEYPANPNKALQEDNEAAAIRVLAERIADELYSRVASNF